MVASGKRFGGIFAVLMVMACHAAPSWAADVSTDTDVLRRLLPKIYDDAGLQSRLEMCPADLYKTVDGVELEYPGVEKLIDACRQNPEMCLSQCMEKNDRGICYELALVLHGANRIVDPLFSQMMYAQACAGGSAIGCTNRAAGIRNGDYSGDPFERWEENDADWCLNKSFELTCTEGDAWGCYMIGQSYEFGEGRPIDEAMARHFYEMACKAGEDGKSACDAALEAIEYLD